MPLPEGGAEQWPPEEYAPVLAQQNTWAAWWSGNLDQLADAHAVTSAPGVENRPMLARAVGYILSRFRRWFHTPPQSGRARQRVHLPLAADIAAGSAGLLFSEPPAVLVPKPDVEEIDAEMPEGGPAGAEAVEPIDPAAPPKPGPPATAPPKTGGTPPVPPAPGAPPADPLADPMAAAPIPEEPPDPIQDRLDELVDEGMHATLQEAAEIAAAMGGVFLRVTWDPEVADKPWLTAVHPDCAIPEWRSGKLTAVTLWRVIRTDGQRVVRHLERHEKGDEGQSSLIRHGVYEGSQTELGNLVPLTDYPETEAIAEAIDTDGNAIETGTEALTCIYVPNMLPNRVWRHLPVAANLGVADICGLESLLDFLDMAYSAWARAVEQGKPRLFMPQQYLSSFGAGEGAKFDIDTEIITPVKAALEDESSGLAIEQVQFPIPVTEFKATIDQLKRDIAGSAGYSGRSFGVDEGATSGATATEVNSLDRKDLITRDRKICYWGPGLQDVLEALTGVDATQFPDGGGEEIRPDIEWPDAVSVDPDAQAVRISTLVDLAMSKETAIRELHPDWTNKQVLEELDKIGSGAAPALDDPDAFAGGPFAPEDEEDPAAEAVAVPPVVVKAPAGAGIA